MVFLRQRTERLGEQGNFLNMNGDLTGLRTENIAGSTDDIADIVLSEIGKFLFAQGIGADIELDLALVVLDMAESGLAHAPLGHHPPGHSHGLAFVIIIVLQDIPGPGAADELCDLEGVPPCVLQGLHSIRDGDQSHLPVSGLPGERISLRGKSTQRALLPHVPKETVGVNLLSDHRDKKGSLRDIAGIKAEIAHPGLRIS